MDDREAPSINNVAGAFMHPRILPVLVAIFFGFIGEALLGDFLPLIASSLTDNALLISSLSAFYYFVLSIFGPFWGSFSDTVQKRKPFIVLGLAITSIGITCCGISGSILELMIFRGVAGLGTACFTPTVMALTTDYSQVNNRGMHVSYVSGTRSAGWAVGALLGGVTGVFYGIQGTFIIGGLLGLVGTLITIFIKDSIEGDRGPRLLNSSALRIAANEVKKRILTLISPHPEHYLKRPGMSRLYLAIFLRNTGTLAIFSLLSILFAEVAGTLPVTLIVGGLHIANGSSQFICMPIMGYIADRIGRKRLVLLGCTGSALVLWIYANARDPFTFLFAQLMVGFSFASLDVGSKAIVADYTRLNQRGEALGFIDTARNLGAVTGAIILGGLSVLFSIRVGIMLMSGFALAAMLLTLKIPESYIRPNK